MNNSSAQPDVNAGSSVDADAATQKPKTEAPPSTAPPVTSPKKTRRGGCGCMLPMLILVALVGFAPQIITMTSLRNQVPALLMAELPPGVEIGSASVGWVSPLQLNDVVIPDDQGRPSLKLKHVTVSRSLWELAKSSENLGKLDIEGPQLQIFLDRGVSNYDQFLRRLASKQGGGKRSLVELQLAKGSITIREETRVIETVPAEVNTAPAAGTKVPTIEAAADPTGQVPLPQEQSAPADEISPSQGAPPDDVASTPRPLEDKKSLPSSRPKSPVNIVEGPLLAIVDIQKGVFKSQASGEEELVAELTAQLREPVVESPLTAEFRWNLPEGGSPGIGHGQLKCDVPSLPLAVLSPWIASFTSSREIGGDIALNVAFEVVPSDQNLLLAGQLNVPHLDLKLGPVDDQSSPFRWVGDDLQLMTEGQGDLAGELLTIESVKLRTPIVNADFAGTIKDLPGAMLCHLTGQCDLNPADLLATLPPVWSERVQFEGLKLGQIRVVGPLRGGPAPTGTAVEGVEMSATAETTPPPGPALRVQADIEWDRANVYGFQSQEARVGVDWSESQLAINPNRMPIGQGHWVASPHIEFTPEGRYLVFDGGPILENIDFTQEMSNSWLRYVSPILGSATSIEGQFSLSASPARVAMFEPYTGDAEGEIEIHSAQVGPGELTRQIIEAIAGIQQIMGRNAAQTQQWLTVNKQKVPFAYAEGRVYHKNLQVGFGDAIVQSQGSVGLDETIDFLVTVPIPEKWLEGKPLLANVKGEKIPFQMGGTLDQPQLDGRSLGEFGKRIGMKSAGGLLQQLIERRLEKKANGEIPAKPPRARTKRKR